MPNQFTASLWGDEAFSAVLSMNPIPKIIEIIIKDTSPPLYNITLHFWYQVFGTSEVAIRALSFTYFLLTTLFVYKIGLLLWDRKTGFRSAVLTFLNPFFFIYAFEGRMYSILALGVTASMYFFLKFFYSEKKGVFTFLGYVLSTTWALYSHHFSIFVLFIQGLWFLYEFLFGKRKAAKKVFRAFILTGILYIPWLMPLYKQTKMVGGGFWLATPTAKDLGGLLFKYLGEGIKESIIKIPYLKEGLSQLALILTIAILVIRKWHKSTKKSFFLLLWFLGPIALTWFISQKFQSIFFDRYLLYTIPAAMLIVGSKTRKSSRRLTYLLIIILTIIDFHYFIHPTKRPFRNLANYVKSTQKKNDLLINWNSSAHHLWESKYYQIPAPLYIPKGDLPFYVGTAQMTDKDILRKIPEGAERVGVITSGQIKEVNLPNYKLKENKIFGELKFLWYQKATDNQK